MNSSNVITVAVTIKMPCAYERLDPRPSKGCPFYEYGLAQTPFLMPILFPSNHYRFVPAAHHSFDGLHYNASVMGLLYSGKVDLTPNYMTLYERRLKRTSSIIGPMDGYQSMTFYRGSIGQSIGLNTKDFVTLPFLSLLLMTAICIVFRRWLQSLPENDSKGAVFGSGWERMGYVLFISLYEAHLTLIFTAKPSETDIRSREDILRLLESNKASLFYAFSSDLIEITQDPVMSPGLRSRFSAIFSRHPAHKIPSIKGHFKLPRDGILVGEPGVNSYLSNKCELKRSLIRDSPPSFTGMFSSMPKKQTPKCGAVCWTLLHNFIDRQEKWKKHSCPEPKESACLGLDKVILLFLCLTFCLSAGLAAFFAEVVFVFVHKREIVSLDQPRHSWRIISDLSLA